MEDPSCFSFPFDSLQSNIIHLVFHPIPTTSVHSSTPLVIPCQNESEHNDFSKLEKNPASLAYRFFDKEDTIEDSAFEYFFSG